MVRKILSHYSKKLDDSASNNSSTTFIQTYGGTNNDSGQSIVSTSDGGYAILGFTQSNDGDIIDKLDESFDYWILKFIRKNWCWKNGNP